MGFIVYVEIKYKKEDHKRWEGTKNTLLYSSHTVHDVIYYLKIDCDHLNVYYNQFRATTIKNDTGM